MGSGSVESINYSVIQFALSFETKGMCITSGFMPTQRIHRNKERDMVVSLAWVVEMALSLEAGIDAYTCIHKRKDQGTPRSSRPDRTSYP